MPHEFKKTSKSQINFIIDVIMLIVMMLAAGIGLLIKYVLLPGFARNLKYGRDVDLIFYGLDRHQWGSAHLIISLILLGLVILHILLHWRQIKQLYRNLVKNSQQRRLFAVLLIVLCIIFSLGPLLIKPSVVASQGHNIHNSNRLQHSTKDSVIVERRGRDARRLDEEEHHSSLSEEIPIYGYMTIVDVANKYDVSATELARHIGVPGSETDRKLGQLRRQDRKSVV